MITKRQIRNAQRKQRAETAARCDEIAADLRELAKTILDIKPADFDESAIGAILESIEDDVLDLAMCVEPDPEW